MGETPAAAAENGGREVALPVLSATLTTAVVFFPVTFLYGVSRFLFSALALTVVICLFASYVVAMTVVPLFCARFIKAPSHHGTPSDEVPVTVDHVRNRRTFGDRFNIWFNDRFESFLKRYDRAVAVTLRRSPQCGIRLPGHGVPAHASGTRQGSALPRTARRVRRRARHLTTSDPAR